MAGSPWGNCHPGIEGNLKQHARPLSVTLVCRRLGAVLTIIVFGALVTVGLGGHAAAQSAATPTTADRAVQAPAPSAEPQIEVSFGASATFVSAFVWRGFVLGSDPAIQPSAWAKFGPLTVTSWSDIDVRSRTGISFREHDLTIDYSRQIGKATLSVGWTNYAVAREPDSNEFYAAIDVGGYLNPGIQVFHDVDEGKGTYAALAVSHTYGIGSTKASITPTLSVGYNHHLWTDRSGFSDINAGLAMSVPTPIQRLSLQPFINYSYGLDAAVFPKRFYGGVTLAVQ